MIVLQVAGALALLALCSIAPGFFFVRRFRWSPLEKLNGSVALSLILIYCASFFIYVVHLDVRFHWLISIASLVLAAIAWRDLARLIRSVLPTLIAFALLLAWCLTNLLLIRHFAGGDWSYDWIEHFHRTIFFLDHLPLDTSFGRYQLSARPPMMNVLATFALAHTGAGFEVFSAVFTYLNVLALLPCVLLMRMMGGRGVASPLLLAALFACNPPFIQNATYTWTKQLTVFYVLVGLWLYLASWRKDDALRTAAAFVALGAGVIVHYSAVPYLLVIAAHYGVRVLRESRWREAFIAAAVSIALVSTWFAWSIVTYGKSNTASAQWSAAGRPSTEWFMKNTISTIVPHPLFERSMDRFQQKSSAGYLRDYTFLIYQTNLIAGIGLIGGPMVIFLLARDCRRQRFWWFFLPSTILLAIAVHGESDLFGIAHVTLQPIIRLGVTFLAARFAFLPRVLRFLIVLGCLADVTLGVLLHNRLQSEEQDTGAFGYVIARSDKPFEWQTNLSQFALRNWWDKKSRIVDAEMAQRPEVKRMPDVQRDVEWQLVLLSEEDRRLWGGWYARHNNRLTFLGDHARRYQTAVYIAIAMFLSAFLMILITYSSRSTPAYRP